MTDDEARKAEAWPHRWPHLEAHARAHIWVRENAEILREGRSGGIASELAVELLKVAEEAYRKGREDERAAVVAHLRRAAEPSRKENDSYAFFWLSESADAIERGEHVKGGGT